MQPSPSTHHSSPFHHSRPHSRLICTLLLTAWWAAQGACLAAERPLNVVLFLVDDMGWMDSSVYGSTYYDTPNMERLSRSALRFLDAYAVPLCSPTRASILTGQYSARHGVTSATGHLPPQPEGFAFLPPTAAANQRLRMPISRNFLAPEQYTLAEALQAAGYRTGHFGKWHLGITPPHWPEAQGFDVAWHCEPSAGPPGGYFSPYGVLPPESQAPRTAGRKQVVGTITDGEDGEYITDRLTDEVIAFLEANREQPFFANIWHYGVHGPWGHKAELTREFAKQSDPAGRQGNPIMASMLKSIDESLGRVLDTLDRLELTDNTLFIFYSDNGGNVHSNVPGTEKTRRAEQARSPMLGDWRRWAGDQPPTNNAPLREGKGRIYEGGQRVPLMIRWPGKTSPGTTTTAVVGPIDLYPTILDCVGLDRPQHQQIDGESLLPVLTGSGSLAREAYFTWFPHLIPAVSVRAGSWKLIRRFEPHPDYPEVRELYNLADDLGESRNLADNHPQRVAHLDALIDDFLRETAAITPQPNPAFGQPAAAASPLVGLVPRSCTATQQDDGLRLTATGPLPFLGTAQVRMPGPLELTLRVRSPQGGVGRVHWKAPAEDSFPRDTQQVAFDIPGGNTWETVSVAVPVTGTAGTVRLYLPATTNDPVDLQRIRFSNGATSREWNFTTDAPAATRTP